MKRIAAVLIPLAALACACGDGDEERKPLPPAISLGSPGGAEAGPGAGSGIPGGHPPVAAPGGAPAARGPRAAPAPAADRFRAPEGWQPEEPSSGMRLLQYRLPRADGDGRDGEVAVFANIMGSTQANIDRWRGQFTEVAQGKDSLTEHSEGLKGKVTLLDITGKQGAGGMGGMAAAHGGPEAEQTRMLAAVVEAPDGTYYVKAVGPPATIGKWEKAVRDFILDSAKR